MPDTIAPTTAPSTPTPATPAAPSTPAPAPDISDALVKDSAVAAMLTSTKKKPAKKVEELVAPAAPVAPAPTPAAPAAATPAPSTPSPTPTPEPAPAQKPKVRVRQPAAPVFDADALTNAVVAGVTKAIPQPAAPAAVVIELPEHIAHNRPLYEQLEQMNPAKYKGLIQKQADFARKEIAYADQWVDRERQRLISEGKTAEANDIEFNADDPQHRRFYEQNAPVIDPDDVTDARVEIKLNEKLGKTVNPQLEEYKRELTRLRAAPAAEAAVSEFGSGLFGALNPESQDFNKWAESNPIEAEIASGLREQVLPVVHAASLLWDGAIDFDQNNEAHTTAANTFKRFEEQLSEYQDQAVDDRGRQWVPLAEFNKMSKKDQARHFTTTKQALVNYIAMQSAKQVKTIAQKQMEIIERGAQRLGYQKPIASQVTQQPSTTTTAKQAQPLASPSVSAAAPISPSAGVAPSPSVPAFDAVAKMLTSK